MKSRRIRKKQVRTLQSRIKENNSKKEPCVLHMVPFSAILQVKLL